jgi:hypothetical protein
MYINSLDDKKGGKEKNDNEDDKQESKMGIVGADAKMPKRNDKINNANSRKWIRKLGACCPNHHIHNFARLMSIFIEGYKV